MRHRKKTFKFGRKKEHRRAMLANLACSLIEKGMIITSVPKAKALRPFAEKMVTLAKGGTLHDRRLAIARLRQKSAVSKLFADIVPANADRKGGYTRIIRLGRRFSDAAEMAILEWVNSTVTTPAVAEPAPAEEKKSKKEKAKAKSE